MMIRKLWSIHIVATENIRNIKLADTCISRIKIVTVAILYTFLFCMPAQMGLKHFVKMLMWTIQMLECSYLLGRYLTMLFCFFFLFFSLLLLIDIWMVIIGVFLIRKLKAEKQGYFTKVGRENIVSQFFLVIWLSMKHTHMQCYQIVVL